MPEQARTETTPERHEETPVAEEPTTNESKTDRDIILSDLDRLLDQIDEVLESEAQQALDEAKARAEYRAKLQSLAFLGKRAVDPCLEPGIIRVPEHVAEQLLSAGLAREHDCTDCD